MATRSSITVRTTKGYKTIYCHWDGYLEGVGKTLYTHFKKKAKIRQLIKSGDVSSLGEFIELPSNHTFDDRVVGYTTFYGRDRGDKDSKAVEYSSLVEVMLENEQEYNYFYNGYEWLVKTQYGDILKWAPLVDFAENDFKE